MVMLPDCATPTTFYAIVDLDGMPKLDTRVTDAQGMHAVYMRMGSGHGKHIHKQAPVRAVAGYAANGQCSER